jgi:uncharacterized protein
MTDEIIWRRLDVPGHEFGRLFAREDGWLVSGTAIFLHAHRPCKLDYAVLCDLGWRTTSARVSGVIGDREIEIEVSIDPEQRWWRNGRECRSVIGCVDIDLGFSPSTNILPIRRLQLNIGQEAEVKAAWLPFPSLEFELLPQVYRREGESAYRYESSGGAFVRVLGVNSAGLVTNYPGLWKAETAT